MENIVIVVVVFCIITGIVCYLCRAKKRGGCIGCPCCNQCSSKRGGECKKTSDGETA